MMMANKIINIIAFSVAILAIAFQLLPSFIKKIHLTSNTKNAYVLVDFNNCFLEDFGRLPVPGSKNGYDKAVEFLRENGNSLDKVIVTSDSHPASGKHISFNTWYFYEDNTHPEPYTIVTYEDFLSGKLISYYQIETEFYLQKVGSIMVYPPHCIKGTKDQLIYEPLQEALNDWEVATGKKVTYVSKGESMFTDELSAFEPEVKYNKYYDFKTLYRNNEEFQSSIFSLKTDDSYNYELFNTLRDVKNIFVSGIVRSICVKKTIESYVDRRSNLFNLNSKYQKFILLSSSMPELPGNEQAGIEFFEKMKSLNSTIVI